MSKTVEMKRPVNRLRGDEGDDQNWGRRRKQVLVITITKECVQFGHRANINHSLVHPIENQYV